jgi:hypothetical protein
MTSEAGDAAINDAMLIGTGGAEFMVVRLGI